MKRILMVFVVTFVLFINSNVYADGICDPSNINRMKEIAKNIEVSYEHNVYGSIEEENGVLVSVYNITVAGLTDELYIRDDNGNKYYYGQMVDGVLNIETASGERKIYIHSKICMNTLLDTRTLNLPVFNFNSLNEECQKEEFKDLDICVDFLKNDEEVINNNEFVEKIEEEKKKNESFIYKIKDYIFDNIVIVIGGSIVLFGIIILLLIRHKKRSVLE